jgi:hypothetical protein
MTRMVSMQLNSKAKARAKEAKTTESVTAAEQNGAFQENGQTQVKGRARAKDSKESTTSAEKRAIRPANATRTKETQRGPGTKGDTEEPGAKDDSKEKAKESAKSMEVKHKQILIGIRKQRINRAKRRTPWIKTGTRSLKGAECWASSRRRRSPWTSSPAEIQKAFRDHRVHGPSRDRRAHGPSRDRRIREPREAHPRISRVQILYRLRAPHGPQEMLGGFA